MGNTFQTVLTLEEELVFSPLIADDPWYWMALNAPVQKTVEISLEHVAPEAASIKLTVWGSTQGPRILTTISALRSTARR